MAVSDSAGVVWSIGHGSRSGPQFLQLLQDSGIECAIDVRAYPASRRHPQFARAALAQALAGARIGYVWEGAALGGRRTPDPASPHTALDEDVRGFADHMTSSDFRHALDRVIALSCEKRCALLCAERLPAHCHRSLIADALVMRGVGVLHLLDAEPPARHALSALARIRDGALLYDGGVGSQLPLL